MNKKVRSITNSKFIKSIFQLAFGSIIAQLVTILCSPILTRLYSVEDMGSYALILSIVTIFGSVINGKYDYAIVSTKNDEDVEKLIIASVYFSLVALVTIAFGFSVVLFFNNQLFQQLGYWSYFSLLLLFFVGLTNILTAFNNRNKEYKLISSVYVLRTSIQNSMLVLSGFFGLGIPGMMLSQFFANFFGIKRQSKGLKKSFSNFKSFSFRLSVKTMKKYKNFPLFSLPANLINNLSYSILNFFISGLYGLTTLGFYSMSFRILGLPLSLVSVNVSKVFFRDAAEEYKDTSTFTKSLYRSTLILLLIAIPMCVVLVLLSPFLFRVFFGREWYVAGEYARVLAPMFSIRLVVSGLTPAFIISGKQKLELVFQTLFLFSSVGTYFVARLLELPVKSFLGIYSLLNFIVYILLYLVIIKLSKGEKND
ncbi:oligosaccharide flippase family protein [Enterococcus gallinarum]|uniref:oligosaccharide flippase family protein n=1 Tax=Enterococcus gallinarum TaxID=1353 RepID=UPI002DBE8F16|nr:oligosaccharide flippase family protein [Enterococcus gallinarum]MEB6040344.1 oligosaccharide flippase family protein [Enterococcus gallinarum]